MKPDPSEATLSIEDQRVLDVLQSSTVKERSHYKTQLLWKGEPIVPNNSAIAVSRLHSTERKLKKDPELAEKKKKVINDYVNRGHAKKMTHEEAKSTSLRAWYLAHHAVLNSNKPGKVHVVFDAAAKFHGVSLNGQLLTGPDLLNNLVGILLRLRSGRISVIADIAQMFDQVYVSEEDRDALRFLWRETKQRDEYHMTVHVFARLRRLAMLCKLCVTENRS